MYMYYSILYPECYEALLLVVFILQSSIDELKSLLNQKGELKSTLFTCTSQFFCFVVQRTRVYPAIKKLEVSLI